MTTVMEQNAGHLFDWTEFPRTTDPRYARTLSYGPQNQVFLDGKNVSHWKVSRCLAGAKGWVEVAIMDDRGIHYKTFRGNVEFRLIDEQRD